MSRFIILTCLFFALGCLTLVSQTLPENFYDEEVRNDIDRLCGITFDERGRMYAWQKKGVVHLIDSNNIRIQQPLLDISEEVGDWEDHGLLAFALDPNFFSNGYFYVWYVVDRHHLLHYGTPEYHPDSTWTHQATIGRLTRYTADASTDFQTIVPNSRKILLGETKETGVPIIGHYHAGGTLLFGEDNTLLLSIGDCTTGSGLDTGTVSSSTYPSQALADGILTIDQDIGLYRCQYLHSLNGKILRLDPATGDGISSNPFYDASQPRSAQSRVWALGLRNPFGMTLVEGTGSSLPSDGKPGTLIVSDVGFRKFEEVNVVHSPGLNFGWPLYQGHFQHYFFTKDAPYNLAAPNPLHSTIGCTHPFFKFKDLLAPAHQFEILAQNPCDNSIKIDNTIHLFKHEPPHISYRNQYFEEPTEAFVSVYDANGFHAVVNLDDANAWVDSENFDGVCSIGGAFYPPNGHFPEKYHGTYLHFDYSGWIKTFFFGDDQHSLELERVEDFLTEGEYTLRPVVHPKNTCLYYIGYQNKIHRICYGGNPKPVAVADADVLYGESPLTVQLDASQSYDAFDEPISFHWDFGDGNTSNEEQPIYTFTTNTSKPTPITVTLTVTDSIGQTDETTLIISLNNTPPVVEITSFSDGDLYTSDAPIILPLEAEVHDEESADEDLTYEWITYLHHNDHFHTDPSDFRTSSYTLLSPLGCDGEIYYYRVALSVTDEHGLTTTVENYLYPNCDGDFVNFIELEAAPNENHTLLQWTTDTEDSVLFYIIEKSDDIWNFREIGKVDAAQNQGSENTYEFVDDASPVQLRYYRVKAYRTNQAFDYSNRITSKYTNNAVEIFPNPSQGVVKLYFTDDLYDVNIAFFDALGKIVLERKIDSIRENELRTLRLDVPDGVYSCQVTAGDNFIWSQQVVILR